MEKSMEKQYFFKHGRACFILVRTFCRVWNGISLNLKFSEATSSNKNASYYKNFNTLKLFYDNSSDGIIRSTNISEESPQKSIL